MHKSNTVGACCMIITSSQNYHHTCTCICMSCNARLTKLIVVVYVKGDVKAYPSPGEVDVRCPAGDARKSRILADVKCSLQTLFELRCNCRTTQWRHVYMWRRHFSNVIVSLPHLMTSILDVMTPLQHVMASLQKCNGVTSCKCKDDSVFTCNDVTFRRGSFRINLHVY